jgi:transposase
MAYNFLRGDRDQPFLLPPDLRDWLPGDQLAWFVLDVVDQLDLEPFLRSYRADGHGHPAYHPKTLLGVLLYAYAIGVRSSRQIQRRCIEDLAFRVLAGNQVPGHVTIARFRVRHQQALAGFLVASLRPCAAAGLVRLGVIALDGTKVAANAGDRANRTLASLQDEVAQILQEAAEADQREDHQHSAVRGDELPAELASPSSRLARLQAAKRGWRPKPPNVSAATCSASPSWPPRQRSRAGGPGRTSSRGPVMRRPTPGRSPTPPIPTAASSTAATARCRATTPRPWSPRTRW